MIRCLQCRAETSNGLALCELCQGKAQLDLVYIPIYFRNLARWKPGHAGSRPVPGSRVLYDGVDRGLGTGDRISDRLDQTLGTFPDSQEAAGLRVADAANTLTTWARVLADDRPYLARLLDRLTAARRAERVTEAEAMAWLCRGFAKYLTSVATLDWCGEFAHDLSHHEEVLRGLTEVAIPGWYAGACRRCEAPTYVVPGLTWVTCRGCGSTTYARDHLEVVLDEARDWVARPKRIAEAIVALVDTEQSVPRLHARIRQWEQRERLTPIQHAAREHVYDPATEQIMVSEQPTGAKRYRLGDVLDLVLMPARTRAVADVAGVS